ncbi:hypothetical protein ES703_58926 [subsurface metagenome]
MYSFLLSPLFNRLPQGIKLGAFAGEEFFRLTHKRLCDIDHIEQPILKQNMSSIEGCSRFLGAAELMQGHSLKYERTGPPIFTLY